MRLKSWIVPICVLIAIFGPTLIFWEIPGSHDWPHSWVILWVILWGAMGAGLYKVFFEAPVTGYRINYEQHYLDIKDYCFPFVELSNQGSQVRIMISYNNSLEIKDVGGAVGATMVTLDGKNFTEAGLAAGDFHVSRQKNGYRVSWSKYENWRLWGI